MEIKIMGLDEKDKLGDIEGLINKEGNKMEMKMGEEIFLEFNIKKYGKTKVNEFEISTKLFCSEKTRCSKTFFEAKVTERDLIKAVRKIFDKLNNEVEHKFHLRDQNKR